MKVTKISVIYSQTVQFRQFEPIQLTQQAEAQIDEGENPKQVFQRVFAMVKEQVDDQVRILKIARKASYMEEDSLEKYE